MKSIQNSSEIDHSKPLVATIGMFDGVHLGHQKLIEFVTKRAKEIEGNSLLFSFAEHPRIVLYNDENIALLTPQKEKENRLQHTELTYYYPMPFDKEFAKLTAFEFVRDVLVNQFNIDELIVGYDHQFGKNREGNFEQLQEYAEIFDFQVAQFPAVYFDDLEISSTKIRKALKAGEIHKANAMLGYEYCLQGMVVKGKSVGSSMGFPTANLELPNYKLIPKNGVYIAEAELQNQFFQVMVNIGMQPTFDANKLRIEAHLLDFNQEIYGEDLKIYLKKYLRAEQQFSNKEALKSQLEKDQLATQNYFKDL